MEFLYNFSALIQLVAAINFAYILCKFNERFDSVINNAGGYIQKKFTAINDKINVDSVTLQSKSEESQTAGFDCSAFVQKLTQSLADIERFKLSKETKINNVISKFVNKEGYCALFLFLSLYTVLDLGIIAWISVSNNWNISLFLYVVNLLSLLYSIYLFLYSTFSEKQLSNRSSVIAFILIILASILLIWINSLFQHPTPMSPKWELLFSIISVLLPFLGLAFISMLLLIVNIWAIIYSQIIGYMSWKQRGQIRKEMKKIDTALEVLNPDDISFQK